MTPAPVLRVRAANRAPRRPEGELVLYWMTSARRLGWSYALDRAVAQAGELGRPLVIFEALRCGYPYASARLHRFVLDGMAEKAAKLAGSAVAYYPYVEPRPGEGAGLLAALAARACLVVTDDSPACFLPRMLAAAVARLAVRVEAVDGVGLLPLATTDALHPTAYVFRRFLQKELPKYLFDLPSADPLAAAALPPAVLPAPILRRYPAASAALLAGAPAALAALPIDGAVAPVAESPGGEAAARRLLARFVEHRLVRYGEGRNDLDQEVTSGLSPYLHYGHISSHEVFAAVAGHEGWTPERLGGDVRGAKAGFWGMSPPAEAFLDQLVTWREVGHHRAAREPGYDTYETLPGWAQATLAKHSEDHRPYLYTRDELAAGQTHDALWNAAQAQLLGEGRIHNYLRMLWGKKILQWTETPEEALATMLYLNDRYALDGRDPNSVSGIFWCLGRYDRPWAPERPVFGVVRYMSSDSARRKLKVDGYLRRWAPGAQLRLG